MKCSFFFRFDLSNGDGFGFFLAFCSLCCVGRCFEGLIEP